MEKKTIEVNLIEKFDFTDYPKLGINVGSHFYFNDEEHQIVWVPHHPYNENLYGYQNGEVFNLSPDKYQGIPYKIRNSNSEPMFQTMLMGCTDYQVELPDGVYIISLFFVEPMLKSSNEIYSLNAIEDSTTPGEERDFDILFNGKLIQSNFNPAKEYPNKYGITISAEIKIRDATGLNINLRPIKGKPVLSGILIEKTN